MAEQSLQGIPDDQRQADLDLAARAAADSEAAWDAVYNVHYLTIWNLSFALTLHKELAEDLLQDTFLKVRQNIAQYRGECPLGGWIQAICRAPGSAPTAASAIAAASAGWSVSSVRVALPLHVRPQGHGLETGLELTDLVRAFEHWLESALPLVPGPDVWVAYGTIVLAVATAFLASATVISLIVVAAQLREVARQDKIASGATQSQVYGRVLEAMRVIDRVLLERPELLKYFYKGVEPPRKPSEALDARLMQLSFLFMDLASDVMEQRRALHTDVDWQSWDAFFRFVYGSSPYLRRFIEDNVDFYTDYVLAAFGHVNIREEFTGRIIGQWEAYEPASGLANVEDDRRRPSGRRLIRALWPEREVERRPATTYPWARTWLLRRLYSAGAPAHTGVLLADVTATARGMTISTWHHGVGRETEPWLHSWLLSTAEGSGIRSVTVIDGVDGRRTSYDLDQHGAAGRATYRIRRYHPVHGAAARRGL